jgi:uncharacterized membrane protein
MQTLETRLQRWREAQLIDAATADRILQFEEENSHKRRWAMILAVGFGTLMLCAGVFLFVAAHWDDLSPSARFSLVLGLVAIFHLVASLVGPKVPAVHIALHLAGTCALGAGIFLAGQIFNLQEHWPSALLLWAIGAILAWLVLRHWPQALLAAILIPWWLGGEWDLATERYAGAWHIAAQGFLLLSIFYMSVPQRETNRHLRSGLLWVGCLSLIPFIADVIWSGETLHWSWYRRAGLPLSVMGIGYLLAYVPTLLFAVLTRKKDSVPIFASAAWVFVLAALSAVENPEKNPWLYLWMALGACGLCFWGVRENRKLFINYGIAIFALTVIAFYFSEVLDKMGRSMGLILLGVIFLAGGWVLHRLRTDLISRAAAGGSR